MKIHGIVLLLLAFTSVARADLAGKWVGFGEWTYEGQGSHCDVMNLTFVETSGQLHRGEGLFDCGMVALHVPSQEWQKQNGDLLLDGVVVGHYEGNTYEWNEPYSPTVDVQTTIQVDGRHLDYQEIWTNKKGVQIYIIKGRLFLHE